VLLTKHSHWLLWCIDHPEWFPYSLILLCVYCRRFSFSWSIAHITTAGTFSIETGYNWIVYDRTSIFLLQDTSKSTFDASPLPPLSLSRHLNKPVPYLPLVRCRYSLLNSVSLSMCHLRATLWPHLLLHCVLCYSGPGLLFFSE